MNFPFVNLQIATNNFRERLGTGGFGIVYKGSLSAETLIAVKRLERLLPQGEREFKTEVTPIGSIHHRNLVRLCGYCSEGLQRDQPVSEEGFLTLGQDGNLQLGDGKSTV